MDQVIRSYGYFRYILIIGGLLICGHFPLAAPGTGSLPIRSYCFLLAYFGIYFCSISGMLLYLRGTNILNGSSVHRDAFFGFQGLLVDFKPNLRSNDPGIYSRKPGILLLLAWDIFDVITRRIFLLYGGG
jgi:hypothetical protein